ncbi:muscle-specific protein 20-like [Asterias rubens]|uniref:muscle-specific protein 20-like n=1 Tax=Asterias rubens TaxID=7604 RepID=UPI0014559986|nr:muscle-specific protein 20-like [Asterias rubens]
MTLDTAVTLNPSSGWGTFGNPASGFNPCPELPFCFVEPFKRDAKYDPELESQCRVWIKAVVGEPLGDNFHEALKDGTMLCKLINVLQPGSVKKINTSKMAFKMMENIGMYLEATDTYGLPKSDSFQTVDLYEAQNMPQVINGIMALGRKAQAKGFNGPTLGPKESKGEKREFTEEQLKAGQNVIGLQMGTNKGASQAGMTAYGAPREVRDSRH